MTAHEAREIAVKACCDPRSVLKYVAGGTVSSNVASRIHRALTPELRAVVANERKLRDRGGKR